MGINPRQLKLPIGTPMQAARRTAPVVASVGAFLNVRVPTVGLHAKGAFVFGKGGVGRYAPHADKPVLAAAKRLYAQAIPLIAAPVAGPLRLHVDFVLEPPANCDPFDGVLLYTGKPDRSNLLKVFEDALRRAGWMVDDSAVVEHGGAKWITCDRALQGVWFVLETIVATPSVLFADVFTQHVPFRVFKFRQGGEAARHR